MKTIIVKKTTDYIKVSDKEYDRYVSKKKLKKSKKGVFDRSNYAINGVMSLYRGGCTN